MVGSVWWELVSVGVNIDKRSTVISVGVNIDRRQTGGLPGKGVNEQDNRSKEEVNDMLQPYVNPLGKSFW